MDIEERDYQRILLDKIFEKRGKNLIVELDTGLGKRILSMMLAKKEKENGGKIVILLNSTASLADTAKTFRAAKIDYLLLSSSIPSKLRKWMLLKGNLIISTPATFLNTIRKINVPFRPSMVIINEVDKIILRTGTENAVLVYPWNELIKLLRDTWIIGLSGTIRDMHVKILNQLPLLFPEIETLRTLLNADVILMDSIMNTDVRKYLLFAKIFRNGLYNKPLQTLLAIISDMIRRIVATQAIRKPSDSDEELIPHLIKTEARHEFVSLTLLRKYAVAMPENRFLFFAHKLYAASLIGEDILALGKEMSNPKFDAVLQLSTTRKKVVVLTSYIFTAHEIERRLIGAHIPARVLTSHVYNKLEVLKWFESIDHGVLVMTPVGERDLDLKYGDLLIVFDTINTVKTMYQRIRRIRKGEIVFLYIRDSFEEKKVMKLIKEIEKRYPWSIQIIDGEYKQEQFSYSSGLR
ncbi:MAG: helicase-related protein [Candidatus Korarchaeota archaeon]